MARFVIENTTLARRYFICHRWNRFYLDLFKVYRRLNELGLGDEIGNQLDIQIIRELLEDAEKLKRIIKN